MTSKTNALRASVDLDGANSALTKRMMKLLFFCFGLAVVCILLEYLEAAPNWAINFFSSTIPSLASAPPDAQAAYVLYFGTTAFGAPIAAGYLLLRDPIGFRLRRAITTGGAVDLKKASFIYLVALPILGLILIGCLLISSSAYSAERVTAGAQTLRLLAYSWPALLLLGPIVSLGLWLLFCLFLTPIVGIFQRHGGNNA